MNNFFTKTVLKKCLDLFAYLFAYLLKLILVSVVKSEIKEMLQRMGWNFGYQLQFHFLIGKQIDHITCKAISQIFNEFPPPHKIVDIFRGGLFGVINNLLTTKFDDLLRNSAIMIFRCC